MTQTTIEWTATVGPDGTVHPGYTFNPWWGCTKVDPGCDHCYAATWAKRFGVEWGHGAPRRPASEATWREPLKWNAKAARLGVRLKVFCASMADVFDQAVPREWRERLFALIQATPHLDWLLLTKRPQLIAKLAPEYHANGWPANVWLGTSVCDQAGAWRIPWILRERAAVCFLSCEPLLGPIVLTNLDCWRRHDGMDGESWEQEPVRPGHMRGLNWVIAGGESGPGARPMHPEWARGLRDQCAAAGVPFFFKQWGEWSPAPSDSRWCIIDGPDGPATMWGMGKHASGRVLDGFTWSQYPGLPSGLVQLADEVAHA